MARNTLRTSATSEFEGETFEFLWTLKNYSLIDENKFILSPSFRGGPKSNHLWHLEMFKDTNSDLSVYLQLDEFGDDDRTRDREIRVAFFFSLLNADGTAGYTNECSKCECMAMKKAPPYMFISYLSLIKEGLVVNDSLKLLCSATIIGSLKHDTCNDVNISKKRNAYKDQLSSDFGRLFKDGVLTDLAVMTNSTTFLAHKIVLAARSSVFSTMFNTNMTETATNAVKIIDFDDVVVKAMLEYLYTGRTKLLNELAFDLFKIADKYNLPGLKEDCEFSIAKNLNVENACPILVMAHTYNASWLLSRVVNYINRNKEDVKKTASFQQAIDTHANLLCKLLI